jgi:PKD repeat protein
MDMKSMLLRGWTRGAGLALVSGLLVTGCTLDNGEAPAVTGPSEFGLSVTMTASPDQLPRDGESQSIVTVTVRDEASRPVAGRRLIASATAGTLSASDVVTGSEGRATFSFTAPAPGTIGDAAVVSVVPVGDNGGNSVSRTLAINFTGPSNRTAPVPSFEIVPANPERGAPVRFDASNTTDEGVPCLDKCSYTWEFGDGNSATGRTVSHAYSVGRAFTVTLTVTDAAGSTASIVRVINVSAVDAPTGLLNVAPDPPFVDKQAVFTSAQRAATGHSIERYEWDFGDGTTASSTTPSIAKTFTAIGVYVVTVSAFDDLGQAGIAVKTITVGSSVTAPVAVFTVAPTSPTAGVQATFVGTSSTVGAGATIVNYTWNAGDGQVFDSGTTATQAVTYGAAGTYVATLTVTDSLGRQSVKSVTVVVQ